MSEGGRGRELFLKSSLPLLIIPYSNQSVLSALYDNYTVDNVEYIDDGISVEVILDERGRGMYSRYITSL